MASPDHSRILSYPEAIREAMEQEMLRDPSVFLMGQGVDDPKRILGTTRGLLEKFGPKRVFDTPLSEDGMMGFAVGAAVAGLRPVHIHIRMDFILLAVSQIVNMAAKMRYMYGGAVSVPIVVRGLIGKSWGQGPQHSQGLYPLFMHIPGLKVVAPATPHDAKGCLIQSIRDDDPVIYVEHRHLYYQKGPVPSEPYGVPFGKARILREGSDVTIVGVSQMAIESLRAARLLEDTGVRAEVIDPVSLLPLDISTIEASVRKTGRLIVVDNSWIPCGAGAEIVARLAEGRNGSPFEVRRMGFAFTTCPTAPSIEDLFYPDARKIAAEAHSLVRPGQRRWVPEKDVPREEVEFKGPF
jgi:pyruvate/2-oxoglutarate/acetoin dehydrogenase E1 component